MDCWAEGDINLDAVELHYCRTGGGKPPMILLHGVTDNGRCWSQIAADLSDRFDVIMPDAYGHGRSGRIDTDLPKQSHTDHLRGFIEVLDIREPILMGHSMGAATAADFASQYPERLSALILEDPPWREPVSDPTPDELARRKKRSVAASRLAGILQQKDRESLIAFCRNANPTWSELELSLWADAEMQFDRRFYGAMRTGHASYPEIVAQIRCPILLISGDPELGGIVTAEVAEKVCGLWQTPGQSRWVQIPGAGHSIRREQPQAFREVLSEFLDDIEAGNS